MKNNKKIFYGNMASGKSVLAKQLADIYTSEVIYLTRDFGLKTLIKEYNEKISDLTDLVPLSIMIKDSNMLIIEDYIGTHVIEILEYFKLKKHPVIILTEKEPDLPIHLHNKVDLVKCTYDTPKTL